MAPNTTLTSPLKKPEARISLGRLHYAACETFFKPCPFCGAYVDVFEVSETRYGSNVHSGWTLECRNMGCIFTQPSPNQSLKNLAECWNNRTV